MRWYDLNTGQIIETAGAPLAPQDPLDDPNPKCVRFTEPNSFGPSRSGVLHSLSHISVNVKLLHEDSQLPMRGHETDAGLDFFSYIDAEIPPFGTQHRNPISGDLYDAYRVLIPTGVAIQIKHGFGLFLWDRSGLSAKHGQHRVAGVIDSSYTGEVKVALVNLSQEAYQIKKGDRIVQGVITPILLPKINVVKELDESTRGIGGFGSTGA